MHLAHNKGVASLKCNELLQVEEDIEESTRQTLCTLQVLQCEHALLRWLDHVVHLAKHVLKKNGLLAHALHTVELLFIEKLRNIPMTNQRMAACVYCDAGTTGEA